ncbi:MAG TPA: hypothetical protein VK923_04575 [Euzebyales bacterium]|nr:hypothetical protein [Euzebyales bacterium]
MSAQIYRLLLIMTIVLGMVAGLWFLPRGFSFGSTVPPQPIELRSMPTIGPTVTPDPAPPSSVDDDVANDDDGADDSDGRLDDADDDGRTSRRADLRGRRVDVPATGGGGVADDDADHAGGDDDDGLDDEDDDDD